MTRHSLFAPVLISCLALAACADPAGGGADTPTPDETVTVTAQASTSAAESVGTVTTTVRAPAPPRSSSPAPPPPTECVTDVRRSDLAPWLDAGRIPLGTLGDRNWEVEPAEGFYYFQLQDSGYDSCRSLSWVSLEGSNGDASGPSGTRESSAEVMVFFHHGQLITNPAPYEMTTVEDVRRTSDFSIRVVYGHAGGTPAEGVTEQYRMNFYYDDGLSGSGELPEGVDGHARLYLN